MIKKVFLFLICVSFLQSAPAFSEDSLVLKTGISLEENIPSVFWGAWRVNAKLIETTSKDVFRPDSVDFWNILKKDNVITLYNPFSGAKASITLKEVQKNKVVFEKEGVYNEYKMHDVVELYLNNDTFSGYNYLKLIKFSDVDGSILETKTAKYSLMGDKMSGYNVFIEE